MASSLGRVVVFGGNGLVGSAVCQALARRGFEVVSVSRRGLPPVGSSGWNENVQWLKGDALSPTTYAGSLSGARMVVSTIGTLLEDDRYKRVLRGSNHTRYGGASYEQINRDTAASIAAAAASEQAGGMLYMSAAACPPGVDKRYLTTKREAEEIVLNTPNLRSVVFRPGFMYSDEAPATLAVGAAMMVAGKLANRLPFSTAAATHAFGVTPESLKPLSTATVGNAAVTVSLDDTVEGVYTPTMINDLASIQTT